MIGAGSLCIGDIPGGPHTPFRIGRIVVALPESCGRRPRRSWRSSRLRRLLYKAPLQLTRRVSKRQLLETPSERPLGIEAVLSSGVPHLAFQSKGKAPSRSLAGTRLSVPDSSSDRAGREPLRSEQGLIPTGFTLELVGFVAGYSYGRSASCSYESCGKVIIDSARGPTTARRLYCQGVHRISLLR